ncbi:MAG: matrixin family metalloprotease, partial [Acidobacteriota bacterium]
GSGTIIHAQAGNTNNFQLGDGQPMLRFDDPIRVCTGSCLAATFTGYYSQRNDGTWRIDDADIVTNTRYDFTTEDEPDGCSSEFYIEGIQVHETGHGLGLGHSNVNGSTMYPSVSSCNNGPATIEQDDADGIDALYGGGGGGGGGGGSCDLGQKGDSCTVDADCCSNKCRGPSGRKSCK